MPFYDYHCQDCGYTWEEEHSTQAQARECPECESANIQRLVRRAAIHAKGIDAHAGDGKRATAEQLRAKWAEETPKLRKKLLAKYGEKALKAMPTLNHDYGDGD